MVDFSQEIAVFDSEVESAQKIITEAQLLSHEAIEVSLSRFSESSRSKFANLRRDLSRLSVRLSELCSVLEGDPVGPLEEAINHARTAEDLLPFLALNDLEQFFLPNKRQKAVVLLDLLEKLGDLLAQEAVLPWFERALLDFDTQDRAVRDRAPVVLGVLEEKVKSVVGAKGHLFRHLIRSLAIEYKK